MKSIKPRIPEGGAIEDNSEMTMEKYSEMMKKQLDREYIRFADNVIRKINPIENSTVLEIGPGPGWAGINLVKKRTDLKLVGLEPSPDIFSKFLSDNMGFYWKSSIVASYTPDEIKAMLSGIGFTDWYVESELMDLKIYKY